MSCESIFYFNFRLMMLNAINCLCRIVRMMEGGVGHRILSQYFAKTTLNCLREEVRNLSPVGIGDVLTLYIIFLSGLIVATGLLAIEVLFVEKRFRFIK